MGAILFYINSMGIQSKDNPFEGLNLGLFVKDPPTSETFSNLEDDVANVLEDGSGNTLRARD